MELWLLLILLGGVVSMDTTSGPQVMVSEPLVSCTILGLLFGMPVEGVLIGILFQLLWLGYMPLGAVRFTDHIMAAFIATASLLYAAHLYGLSGEQVQAGFLPAMLFGVLVGSAGLHLTDFIRDRNGGLSENLQARFERGEMPGVGWWHLAGMAFTFLKGAAMAVVFVPVGAFLCGLTRHLTGTWDHALALGSLIILGAVAAPAVHFYWLGGKHRYLLYGSVGGVLWFLLTAA